MSQGARLGMIVVAAGLLVLAVLLGPLHRLGGPPPSDAPPASRASLGRAGAPTLLGGESPPVLGRSGVDELPAPRSNATMAVRVRGRVLRPDARVAVGAEVEARLRLGRPVAATRTASTGTFDLHLELPAGRGDEAGDDFLLLEALDSPNGLASWPEHVDLKRALTGEPIELRLRAVSSLDVRVLDPAGRAAPAAQIMLYRTAPLAAPDETEFGLIYPRVYEFRSNEAGECRCPLPPGMYWATARPDPLSAWAAPLRVRFDPAGSSPDGQVALHLARGTKRVSLECVDDTGVPVQGAWLATSTSERVYIPGWGRVAAAAAAVRPARAARFVDRLGFTDFQGRIEFLLPEDSGALEVAVGSPIHRPVWGVRLGAAPGGPSPVRVRLQRLPGFQVKLTGAQSAVLERLTWEIAPVQPDARPTRIERDGGARDWLSTALGPWSRTQVDENTHLVFVSEPGEYLVQVALPGWRGARSRIFATEERKESVGLEVPLLRHVRCTMIGLSSRLVAACRSHPRELAFATATRREQEAKGVAWQPAGSWSLDGSGAVHEFWIAPDAERLLVMGGTQIDDLPGLPWVTDLGDVADGTQITCDAAGLGWLSVSNSRGESQDISLVRVEGPAPVEGSSMREEPSRLLYVVPPVGRVFPLKPGEYRIAVAGERDQTLLLVEPNGELTVSLK